MNRHFVGKIACSLIAGSLIIHGLIFWKERREVVRGYPDFAIFYTAGLILGSGEPHNLYDRTLQFHLQREFAPDVKIRLGPLPYNHPPFEALLFLPLAKFTYLHAYVAWGFLNLLMLASLPILLRRHIAILQKGSSVFWFFALLAFFPIFITLLHGQDSVLLLFLFALALAALSRKSDFESGCWLALGCIKIQFVLPLLLILCFRQRRRVLLGFLLTAVLLAAVSVAVVGLPQTLHYPHYVLQVEQMRAGGAIIPEGMPNLRGLVEGWAAAASILFLNRAVLVLSLVLLVYVIAVSRRLVGQPALQFALAVLACVLVSYHAFASDLALLAIPLILICDYVFQAGTLVNRDFTLMLGPGLLLLTPLYVLLWFRFGHANLLAAILLLWLWQWVRPNRLRSLLAVPENQRQHRQV
jgi:Glycosyltransferase family 87